MKIKYMLAVLNVIILFSLFPVITSSKCNQVKWKKFIDLGDSNTQMGYGDSQWVSRIGWMFERKLDVINRGFSGYNSEHVRYFLKEIIDEFDVKSIAGMTILLGTNDSQNKSNTIQHVPLDRYKENMKAILTYLINVGVEAKRIILISPPKIDDKKIQQVIGVGNTFSDDSVKEYAQVCRDIVSDLGVLFLDLYKAMEDEGDEKFKEYLSDGLHFSHKGGIFFIEKLKPFLDKNIDIDLNTNFPFYANLTLPNKANKNNSFKWIAFVPILCLQLVFKWTVF